MTTKTRPLNAMCAVVVTVMLGSSINAEEAGRLGGILGTVLDATTQAPLAQVAVVAEDVGRNAETDSNGRFELRNIPAGSYRVLATRTGYLPKLETDVVVTRGRDTLLTMRLQAAPTLSEEVDVQASSFSRSRESAASTFSMSYEELRRAPGAFGGDVSRLLHSLPGLAPRDDMRNDVIARGGSPAENLVLVDGIEVPGLSHFGSLGLASGGISMVSAELVGETRFVAGGFPAQYGDRLSSVLEVWLREGNRRRFECELDVGTAGAGFLLEGPLGGRGSWLANVRRSYVDLIAGSFDASGVPVYANYQAKLVYDLDDHHRLSLLSLGGGEDLQVRVDEQDDDDANTFDADQMGRRATTGVSWRALLGRTGASSLSLAHAVSTYHTSARDLKLDGALVAQNSSSEHQLAIRHDLVLGLGRTTARAGWAFKRQSASLERANPLGMEDPYSIDPSRVNTYEIDQNASAWSGGAYLQLSRLFGRWVTMSLGGRYDYYDVNAFSTLAPRASLAFHPRSNLDLSASWGRYFQMPALVHIWSHEENLALKPIRADHVVVGAAYYPSPDVKLTIEAYDKRYFDYPVARDFPHLSLANKGDDFDLTLFLAPLVSRGDGRARGVELYLQKKLSRRLYGQVSYAFSRTEHKALDGIWRNGSYDLPHVFTLVGGVKITPRFEVSSRFRCSSGKPRTSVLEKESREQNRLVLDARRINAERAPAFHRLDIRADRRFSLGWGNIVAYLEVDNLYDRENYRNDAWNSKTQRRQIEHQSGRLILGGFNVEF